MAGNRGILNKDEEAEMRPKSRIKTRQSLTVRQSTATCAIMLQLNVGSCSNCQIKSIISAPDLPRKHRRRSLGTLCLEHFSNFLVIFLFRYLVDRAAFLRADLIVALSYARSGSCVHTLTSLCLL